jgi:hypothetical protein
MPASIEFDPERRIMTVTVSGLRTVTNAAGVLGEMLGDPRLEPDCGILADFRDLQSIPTEEEARQLFDLYTASGLLARYRIAVVVTRPVHVVIASMIALRASFVGGRLQVFDDRAAAERWLERSRAPREPSRGAGR